LYYESIFVHGGLLKVPRCVRKNIFFILSSAEIGPFTDYYFAKTIFMKNHYKVHEKARQPGA